MEDQYIWNFFIEKFNNPYGVSALMGNLYVESKLEPMDLQGSYRRKFNMTSAEYTEAVDNGIYTKDQFIHDSAGYGLVQWTYWSRKEGLYDLSASKGTSIADLDTQLEYIMIELPKYKTVYNAILNAEDIRSTSDIIAIRYENPQHTEEEYLQYRAECGQMFFDKFTGGDIVNTAKQVDNLLSGWKSQGLSKPDICVNLANACMGWSYVYGARGEYCTPQNRRSYYNSKKKETIKTKCKNFNGSGSDGCNGCKWYPKGVTRFFDCRGFTYWVFLNGANIKIVGGGATSQYNDDSNWSEKGEIANMPRDKVCCVFRHDNSTGKMEHTLIYDGQGNYIHCSGEVKKCATSKYNATHYAIPKGLYDGGGGGGGDKPICIAKVVAQSGGTVNMRKSPSTNADIVARVPIGTTVDVYEKGSDWCKIKYGGQFGYMMTKFLDFGDTPQPSKDTATVYASTGSTVNMRSQPNKDAPIIMRVPIGATVHVDEYKSNWCKITYSSKTGYMMTEFLRF